MSRSRRHFLTQTSLGLLGAAAACRATPQQSAAPPTAGMPPAFGTGPVAGPEVSASTFAAAEPLMQVTMKRGRPCDGCRQLADEHGAVLRAPHRAAQGGARSGGRARVALGSDPARAEGGRGPRSIHTQQQRARSAARQRRGHRLRAGVAPLAMDRAAHAHLGTPHQHLSAAPAAIRSEAALRHHAHARAGARAGETGGRRDRRRPLPRPAPRHPVGRQGSVDTAGIATTYGAEPFRNRIPTEDAAIVKRLHEAGAVLVAKLSLGALALNDIWFGGQTMNPWLLEEGASGSSAGPGAAVAAGLVGFAIGSDTLGSIVDPSMRCGIDRAPPHVRPRAAHRRDDALLVARHARSDDPQRRGCPARARRHYRTGRRRRLERAEQARFRCQRAGHWIARRLLPRLDEGESRDRRGPRRAEPDQDARHDARRGDASRLAVRLADADPLRRSGRVLRGADAERRTGSAEGAGAGRVAQLVPPGAIPLCRRFRAGRSAPAQGGRRDGAHLFAGGCAAGALAPR